MKATQLAAITGFSRQWLSHLAERGVDPPPGAVRRENGRWDYPDSPELKEWAARQGRIRKAKIRRRADISGTEIRRLERLKRRAMKPATRAKLQERIGALKERAGNYLTVAEVAHRSGFPLHHIRRIWRGIPGAMKKGKQLIFITDLIAGWLEGNFRTNKFGRAVMHGGMGSRVADLVWDSVWFRLRLAEMKKSGSLTTSQDKTRMYIAEILNECAKECADFAKSLL